MFAIDPRSLAAFRIGIAFLLLADLYGRAVDLSAFYTDDGVVPRVLRIDMLGYGDPLGFQHQWSLHMLSGELWSQALLIGVAAWFASWLLVGYRTQLAAVASWILISSIDNRNPLVLDGGDTILRAMLFWSLFLPLGICWSVDRQRAPLQPKLDGPISSVISAVLLLQLALMYFSSATFKLHPVWTREFSAVYYALNGDTFITELGLLLREHPVVMQWLTGATVALEFGGPVLAFCPWKNPWCRGVAILAFTLFHLGLALTMTLNLFPWVCIASWMLFIPTSFWDWLQRKEKLRRWGESLRKSMARVTDHLPAAFRDRFFRRPELPRCRSSWWRQAVVGLLFLYVVVWNIREARGPAWVDRIMPHRYNGLAIALGLAQNWSMFAPIPRIEDGWLIMRGTLRDGTEVNLWEPGRPLPWEKPRLVSSMFPSSRWRRYLENLPVDQYALHRQYLADWLQRRWDRNFSGGVEEKEVAKVEIIRQMETTPSPGQPIPQPEPVEICTRHY
jgi:hypothetical protein